MGEKVPFRITDATLDVLAVLLTDDEELYGLRIAKCAGRASGSVVPILMRLERCGWVSSRWETDERHAHGPRRRFYQLDGNHVAAASALVASRQRSPLTGVAVLRPGMEGS